VGVDHYFRDVVSQLLKCRSDKPLEYMHNFFLTVKGMEHTAHREFAFVRSTAHNRHAFILTCERAFGHFHDTDKMVPGDLHQLLLLICPDFPESIIQEAAGLLSPPEGPTSMLEFETLRTAFFIFFFYHEYLVSLRKHICRPLGHGSDGGGGGGGAGKTAPSFQVASSRLISPAEIKDHMNSCASTPCKALGVVPWELTRNIFLDGDGHERFTMPAAEFMDRLLRHRDLARRLRRPPVARERVSREAAEEIAALFQRFDATEVAGGSEEDERTAPRTGTKSNSNSRQGQKTKAKKGARDR